MAKLRFSVKAGDMVIPAGTDLQFGNEGFAFYQGKKLNIYSFPSKAFVGTEAYDAAEVATESYATLAKSIKTKRQVIPAGTKLAFSNEGFAMFNGEQLDIYNIPSSAFVGVEADGMVNNQLNPEATFKKFEDIQPGDMGVNKDGTAVRFLGKAMGSKGYDALLGQFGNASSTTFEMLVDGMSDDEIDATPFVAFTDKDGIVCIDIYGANYVSATESGAPCCMPYEQVEAGMAGMTNDGKPVTIFAKGIGKVWFDRINDSMQVGANFDDCCDAERTDDIELVLAGDAKNNKYLMCYCPETGIYVPAEK